MDRDFRYGNLDVAVERHRGSGRDVKRLDQRVRHQLEFAEIDRRSAVCDSSQLIPCEEALFGRMIGRLCPV